MSDDEEKTAADDAVISKYMQASEIANGTRLVFFISFVLIKCTSIIDEIRLFLQLLLRRLSSAVLWELQYWKSVNLAIIVYWRRLHKSVKRIKRLRRVLWNLRNPIKIKFGTHFNRFFSCCFQELHFQLASVWTTAWRISRLSKAMLQSLSKRATL